MFIGWHRALYLAETSKLYVDGVPVCYLENLLYSLVLTTATSIKRGNIIPGP